MMKKLFTLMIALGFVSGAFAQTIQNGDFESWTDLHEATGWNSAFTLSMPVEYSGMQLTVNIDYNAATRYADAHSGTYSAQLSSQTANAQLYGMTVYSINIPGIIQLGEFNIQGLSNMDFENMDMDNLNLTDYVYGGVAFNEIPEKATAWIAYTTTSDTMSATVMLTRWNGSQREIVAKGEYKLGGSTEGFTQIEIPVTVNAGMESVTPDTLNVIFASATSTCDANTLLTVDDVQLVMNHDAIFEIGTLPIFSVRPNPTTENIVLTPATTENYSAHMFDMNGKMVWNAENLQGETQVNVSSFSKGTYFLQVKQGENVKSEKVIVR